MAYIHYNFNVTDLVVWRACSPLGNDSWKDMNLVDSRVHLLTPTLLEQTDN